MSKQCSLFLVPPVAAPPTAAYWAALVAVTVFKAAQHLGNRMANAATPAAMVAAISACGLGFASGLRQRLAALADPPPLTAEDLLGLARDYERHSPNLADELRWLATRRPEAALGSGHE